MSHHLKAHLVTRSLRNTQRSEAESAQPVVGSHYDDVPLYPGVRTVRPPPHKVEIWIITEVASPFVAPAIEVATEDPKHDWQVVS